MCAALPFLLQDVFESIMPYPGSGNAGIEGDARLR
jgi:hypothetical protein